MAHDRAIVIRIETALLSVVVATFVHASPSVVGAPGAVSPAAIVTHGPRASAEVALTFDVCPTRAPVELDERIVEELVAAHAHATFFVSGRWAEALPDAVRRLAAEPLFEIGNHSFRHPHLTTEPDAEVHEELARTQALLHELTGRTPRLFRPPFGEVDERVAGIAAGVGLVTVQFDVASGDPAPGVTAEALVRSVLERVRRGSIVVMHANHRRFPTAEAVPDIVAGLRARGLEPVTVSTLVGEHPSVERAP
jgi:peptidoglycan/xylan/chitin deacetylase (PgdA/CDA1 family)